MSEHKYIHQNKCDECGNFTSELFKIEKEVCSTCYEAYAFLCILKELEK